MEKFALLDFLKAFEALSSNGSKNNEEPAPNRPEKEAPVPVKAPAQETLGTDFNAMANVLSRHEEIANRIKNKRPV